MTVELRSRSVRQAAAEHRGARRRRSRRSAADARERAARHRRRTGERLLHAARGSTAKSASLDAHDRRARPRAASWCRRVTTAASRRASTSRRKRRCSRRRARRRSCSGSSAISSSTRSPCSSASRRPAFHVPARDASTTAPPSLDDRPADRPARAPAGRRRGRAPDGRRQRAHRRRPQRVLSVAQSVGERRLADRQPAQTVRRAEPDLGRRRVACAGRLQRRRARRPAWTFADGRLRADGRRLPRAPCSARWPRWRTRSSGLHVLSDARGHAGARPSTPRRARSTSPRTAIAAASPSSLDVVSAQQTLLANQRLAVQLEGERLVTTVGLVKALGGGWDASSLAAVVEKR